MGIQRHLTAWICWWKLGMHRIQDSAKYWAFWRGWVRIVFLRTLRFHSARAMLVAVVTAPLITGRCLRRWSVQRSRLWGSGHGSGEQNKLLFGRTFSQKKTIQVQLHVQSVQWTFITADMLTCHSSNSTAEIDNLNDGSVPSSVPVRYFSESVWPIQDLS